MTACLRARLGLEPQGYAAEIPLDGNSGACGHEQRACAGETPMIAALRPGRSL